MNKVIRYSFLGISIVGFLFHLIWLLATPNIPSLGIGSYLLNVIPYLLPIAVALFVFFKKEVLKKEIIIYSVFYTIYLAMILHVTILAMIVGIVDAYFNIPLIYGIPLLLSLIILVMVVKNPREASVVSKSLYGMIFISLVAMVIHSGVVLILDFNHFRSQPVPSSSAPWWIVGLLVASSYLLVCILLSIVYYFSLKKKADKKKS